MRVYRTAGALVVANSLREATALKGQWERENEPGDPHRLGLRRVPDGRWLRLTDNHGEDFNMLARTYAQQFSEPTFVPDYV